MGFTDNLNSIQNPAKVYLRWKGKAEKVREDGVEKIEGGKLIYWDKEAQEEKEVQLPIVVCPLEVTYSYNGFLPKKGRFWSNEILDFNSTTITVHLTSESDEIIASGLYNEINEKAYTAGARLQTNVYCYCKALGGIVRLNLGGSAKTAWREFVKKVGHANIYNAPIQISAGEVKESELGPYVPPKYTLGQAYADDVIKSLTEEDKAVVDYLKYIASKPNARREVSDIEPSLDIPENVENAIPGVAEAQDEQIDLSEIPF